MAFFEKAVNPLTVEQICFKIRFSMHYRENLKKFLKTLVAVCEIFLQKVKNMPIISTENLFLRLNLL